MKIQQINMKRMPASTVCRIVNETLEIEVSWPTKEKQITRSFDLPDIIKKYGEDHGCIALCYSPKFADDLIWHETTRFTCAERIASNKSYTSIMETGPSVKDTPTSRGRHNAASPAWVIKQRLDATAFLYLLTPVRDCKLEDAVLVFHGVDNAPETPTKDQTTHKLFVDGKLQSPPALPSLKMFLESWLPIEIKGPAKMKPDTIADFTIGAPEGAVVYIEATAGIINRMRARDGQKFSLETRGLEVGEEIAIKAGYKFWPGVSEKRVVLA